jgi:hypothetical protein
MKSSDEHPKELQILAEAAAFELGMVGSESLFESPSAELDLLLPGCADLQAASIQRIGYRGEFPRPVEWENLLSMLEPGQELLWIVTKRPQVGFSFHLALKSNPQPGGQPSRTSELRSLFRSVLGQFTKRSFPESLAEECPENEIAALLEGIGRHANGEVVVTSGCPSPSVLEDSREFPEPSEERSLDTSLNDIVEPFADEDGFSIVFTVGRASPDEANQQLNKMAELRTVISPFLKIQNSENRSKSKAKQQGSQRGKTESIGQTQSRDMLSTFVQKVFGSWTNDIPQLDESDDGRSTGLMKWTRNYRYSGLFKTLSKSAVIRNVSSTETISESLTETDQFGTSTSLTSTNAMLELLDQKLQDGIRSLKKAAGTGAYFLGAEVFSPKTELSLRIARSISGSLAGARTHIRPFQTMIHRGPGCFDHLITNSTLDEIYPSITTQSRHVAALFLPVPEADLPGLKTKRNVFYGKPNPSEQLDEVEGLNETVWLGDLAHLTSGFKSRLLPGVSQNRGNTEFRIPARDVTSHLLIAGTTGSGKTQRAAALLNSLSKQRFQVVVIESAKKTYRHLLRRKEVSTRILSLGVSGTAALRINPFYFEPGTSLKRHISIFSDALADLLPVEALIGPKLREAIQKCYLRYQWDIETGVFRGEGAPVYPNMADLHLEVMAVAAALKYGPELNSNYQGALLGRTKLFIDELYQDIFGWGGSASLTEIFGEDDIIIEMDELPPSEAKMPSFVLSLLLERMRAWQQSRGAKRDLVIVIEEAHNLLDKALENHQSGREMGSGGFLLKQIVRLLQEGREAGMGIIVVDQSPASLADAVIRNTNTKIILRITDSEEAERIGSSLGLSKEEYRDLHDLEDGEAVVKVKNAGKALKLCPGQIVEKRKLLPRSTPSHPKSPDYFNAARSLHEFERMVELRGKVTVDELSGFLHRLFDTAPTNPEARRFFLQKALGIACEGASRTVLACVTGDPTITSAVLLLAGILNLPEANSLSRQLYFLLSRTPWEVAREAFEATPAALISVLESELQSFQCWSLMGGSQQFATHLRHTSNLDSDSSNRETAYEQAMISANLSPERTGTLKNLLLYLAF